MNDSTIRIERIEQTPLFINEKGELKNLVRLTIINEGSPIEASLLIIWNSNTYTANLGSLKKGKEIYHAYIPDIREQVTVTFSICDPHGRVLDKVSVNWKPKRHWLVYVVQYSHHDLGYTDLPQNVLNEYVSFYDSIIKFCEETDKWPKDVKFKYQIEQVWSLAHYIRTQPKDKVDKLVKLIRGGRVGVSALLGNEVTGLCGHEELIRLIYPAFRLKKKYGISVKVAELNDVPGFSWGLASVLAGSGIRIFAPLLPRWYYKSYQMPYWDEDVVTPRGIPTALWWESITGDRILLWYQDIGFGSDIGLIESYEKVLRRLPKLLDTLEEKGYPFDAVLIRITGGHRDNAPPSLKPCLIAKEWNDKWAYPKIIISTLSDFFEHLEKKYAHILEKMPVFRGEVPDSDYPVGATSTVQATVLNRNAHDMISTAEKFAIIADCIMGLNYPYKRYLEEAYEHSLLYDEHTWGLCCPFGPAQEGSRVEKTLHAFKAYALAHDVLVKSLNRIVDGVNLEEDGYFIIVFNPLSWRRTDIVRVPLREPDPCGHPMFEAITREGATVMASSTVLGRPMIYLPLDLINEPFEIVDLETGESVKYQKIIISDPKLALPFAAERVGVAPIDERFATEIVFLAKDVPPLGYKIYKLRRVSRSETHARIGCEREDKEEYIIENRFYRVKVDPKTGLITSIYDKELGKELVDENAPHGFNQLIVRESHTAKEHYMKVIRIKREVNGPLIKSISIEGKVYGCPLVVQQIILYEDIKRIDIYNRIVKDSTPLVEIYFAFPFRIRKPCFKYEGPNIVVTPIKDQFPGSHTCYYPIQHWVNIYDEEEGISVTWASIDAHLAELGGLWPTGVSWAHHSVTPHYYPHKDLRVNKFERGHIYSFVINNNFRTNFYAIQVADVLFRYSITSYKGDWTTLVPTKHGWGTAIPLIPVLTKGKKHGKLPCKPYSFCEIDKPNILLLTIKPAEDSEDSIILRLWETLGLKSETTITLPFAKIEKAFITDLVEENPVPTKVLNDNKVRVVIKPFSIMTIKIKLKASKT